MALPQGSRSGGNHSVGHSGGIGGSCTTHRDVVPSLALFDSPRKATRCTTTATALHHATPGSWVGTAITNDLHSTSPRLITNAEQLTTAFTALSHAHQHPTTSAYNALQTEVTQYDLSHTQASDILRSMAVLGPPCDDVLWYVLQAFATEESARGTVYCDALAAAAALSCRGSTLPMVSRICDLLATVVRSSAHQWSTVARIAQNLSQLNLRHAMLLEAVTESRTPHYDPSDVLSVATSLRALHWTHGTAHLCATLLSIGTRSAAAEAVYLASDQTHLLAQCTSLFMRHITADQAVSPREVAALTDAALTTQRPMATTLRHILEILSSGITLPDTASARLVEACLQHRVEHEYITTLARSIDAKGVPRENVPAVVVAQLRGVMRASAEADVLRATLRLVQGGELNAQQGAWMREAALQLSGGMQDRPFVFTAEHNAPYSLLKRFLKADLSRGIPSLLHPGREGETENGRQVARHTPQKPGKMGSIRHVLRMARR